MYIDAVLNESLCEYETGFWKRENDYNYQISPTALRVVAENIFHSLTQLGQIIIAGRATRTSRDTFIFGKEAKKKCLSEHGGRWERVPSQEVLSVSETACQRPEIRNGRSCPTLRYVFTEGVFDLGLLVRGLGYVSG